MIEETLCRLRHKWRQAGARTLKIVVADREAGRLLYELCYCDHDFVIEFQVAPGIKVFVIETEVFNRDEQDGQDMKINQKKKMKAIRFRCIFCGREFDSVEECNACEKSH